MNAWHPIDAAISPNMWCVTGQKCSTPDCDKKARLVSRRGNQLLCERHARGVACKRLTDHPVARRSKRLRSFARFEVALQSTEISRLFAWPDETGFAPGFFVVKTGRSVTNMQITRDGTMHLEQLSPHNLGPLLHMQPGLPVAKKLMNFLHGNELYAIEIGRTDDGVSRAAWERTRELFYVDDETQNFKFGNTLHEHLASARPRSGGGGGGGGDGKPLTSVFIDKRSNKSLYLNELEQRVVACSFYEHLARQTEQFAFLVHQAQQMRRSFVFVGAGARTINFDFSLDDCARWFLDTDDVFGHEMTLLMMLKFIDVQDMLPWRFLWQHMFDMTFEEYMRSEQ
jgi:hypothetical protein